MWLQHEFVLWHINGEIPYIFHGRWQMLSRGSSNFEHILSNQSFPMDLNDTRAMITRWALKSMYLLTMEGLVWETPSWNIGVHGKEGWSEYTPSLIINPGADRAIFNGPFEVFSLASIKRISCSWCCLYAWSWVTRSFLNFAIGSVFGGKPSSM
jgi:hypothetical protein